MDTCTSVLRENQSYSSELFQFILTRKTAFHKIKGYFHLAYWGNKFTTSTKNSQFCDPPLPPSTKTNNRSFQDPHLLFMWQSQTNGPYDGKAAIFELLLLGQGPEQQIRSLGGVSHI